MDSNSEVVFDRPKSEDELASILKTVYAFASSGNYDKAIGLCDWLQQDPATETAGRRQRSAVKTHLGDIDGAIADLRMVLETDGAEPADFHALGSLLLQAGSTAEAIERFGDAVKIGEAVKNHYYTNSSLLFRAEGKLKVGDFAGALKVSNSFRMDIEPTFQVLACERRKKLLTKRSLPWSAKHNPSFSLRSKR
ncbi:MAG: hypothetical protein ABWY27_01120 [Telluria sp.]